jgi:hypothetical protein
MAKRSHPPKTIEEKSIEITIRDLIKNSIDKSSPTIYANHAQFGMTGNEIFVDFYRLEPNPGVTPTPSAYFVQRIIIPVSLGKGFAVGLANLIDGFERSSGIAIPNNRAPDPQDTIRIWE